MVDLRTIPGRFAYFGSAIFSSVDLVDFILTVFFLLLTAVVVVVVLDIPLLLFANPSS